MAADSKVKVTKPSLFQFEYDTQSPWRFLFMVLVSLPFCWLFPVFMLFRWFRRKFLDSLSWFLSELDNWTRSHPLTPLFPLTWKLLCTLVSTGPRWFILSMKKLFSLIIFGSLLSSAWIQIGWSYFTSENMRRNIRYGSNARNYLDLYFPDATLRGTKKSPVVIYLTGGAWIIGYKAWGTLIAKELAKFNIICVTPDYRNFPQGSVADMVSDVNQAIGWVVNNIENFGGDKNNIYLVGQSAGAQLSSVVLLKQLELELSPPNEEMKSQKQAWSPSQLKGFVGLSGPYDILGLEEHFHHRGLHKAMLAKIFGPNPIESYSPYSLAQKLATAAGSEKLQVPPFWFFHGKKDESVPFHNTVKYANLLQESFDTQVKCKLYPHKTHTDPIVEDLLMLGKVFTEEDHFISDLVDIIVGLEDITDKTKRKDTRLQLRGEVTLDSVCGWATHYPVHGSELDCLVHPEILKIAKWFNPF